MPKIAVIVVRNPDSADEVTVFIDGVKVDHADPNVDVYTIDPGAGHVRLEWVEGQFADVTAAREAHGDAVADFLDRRYDEAGESEYIED